MKVKFQFILLALFAGLNLTVAATATLNWNTNSAANTAGYNIYYGTTSGNYTTKLNAGKVAGIAISNLTAGVTYYFSATTVDTSGNESIFSNEATYIVPGVLTLSKGANPGDPMLIKFPVTTGHWYEVQASTNLQTWATIWQTTVATTNICLQFTDPNAGSFSSRFYRLVLH